MSAGGRKFPQRVRVVPAPKPVTLAATLTRALVMVILAGLLLAAIGVVYPKLPTSTRWAAPEHHSIADRAKPAKGTQAWVIKKAHCKPAAEGTVGTSVVVSPVGAGWQHRTGDKAIGAALEQLVFDGVLKANEWVRPIDHNLRVAVFCR